MLNRWLLSLLFLSGLLFASETGSTETDILPRVVNFLIFAYLVHYLLTDKIKAFFQSRKDGIKSQLESVQVKLKETKKRKEEALNKVKESEKIAKEVISDAKKESILITDRIENSLKKDIEVLEKQYEAKKDLENRKVIREVVTEVLDEMFEGEVAVNEKEFVNIILKKVQ